MSPLHVEPYGVKRSLWQSYLSRRYRSIAALNVPYGTNWNSFVAISYPVTLPTQTIPLWDWFKFESFVLATIDAAHRFTVLLPFNGQTLPAVQDRIRQLKWRSAVNFEKPAHTSFDVKFYWALCSAMTKAGHGDWFGRARSRAAASTDPGPGVSGRRPSSLRVFHGISGERQILGRDRLN